MRHLVQFSTGLSSAEVAWRLADEHGPDDVKLLTADTTKEDPDNWRFGREVAGRLGCEWIILCDGRNPMEVGRDRKCIPNNRMAVCSQILKRELLAAYMAEHYDPAESVVYIGYDWSEPHRIKNSRRFWNAWTMDAPLSRPPYAGDLEALFRSRRIEPPDLYRYKFPHANCGGACVRGGQAQWEKLLRVHPDRYLDWEAEENKSRDALGKDVSILRDRTGGTVTPLTLTAFRERITEEPGLFDRDDWGACGCDMDGAGLLGEAS